MIEFSCQTCGKAFSVRDDYAGRSARCKKCGTALTVPLASAPSPTPAVAPRLPVRTRRLIAEAEQMKSQFTHSPDIHIRETIGEPPEIYRIDYRIKGLERAADKSMVIRNNHSVEIQLTSDYPRLSPKCRMLTPIFHPNIDPSTICVGDHWTAGEHLVDLVIRIGEMIAYQAYNIRSPLDGEAAMWADLHQEELPIDNRCLRSGGVS